MWDVSAFIGTWPLRHLPDAASPDTLQARLRQWGVTRAYVSPLEALLQADPMPANGVWSARLSVSDFFRFVPVLNPSLPVPAERALADIKALPGDISALRLYPGYHGYRLDSEAVLALAQQAGRQGLAVIVQVQMQDVRGMHPLLRVPDTDPADILALALACPETTVIAAGVRWGAANALAKKAAETPDHRLYLETSHLEFIDPIRRFVDQFGADRLLAGSHVPILMPAALRMKLDAARLTGDERDAITMSNAGKAGFR